MRQKFLGLSAVAFIVLGLGCARTELKAELAVDMPTVATSGDSGVRSHMLVTTDWLADHLNDPNVRILHVAKKRDGYAKEHIPGAQFLAWNDVATTIAGEPNELRRPDEIAEVARDLGLDRDKRIVLYDEEFGIPAARAYVALDYVGLGEQAALLDGQLKKWKMEERPVTRAVPNVARSSFQPTVNTGMIATFDEIRDLVAQKRAGGGSDILLVDARPLDQYTGQKPGDGIKRGGHIPGAVDVASTQNLVSQSVPVLLPSEQLRQIYRDAGATPGDEVVTYCRTGGQASLAYFASKYLGYDTKLYEGSFYEWSHKPDTAVQQGRLEARRP